MARGDLVVRLLGDTSDLDRKFRALGAKLQRQGAAMAQVGRSLTVGLTLPIVGAGAAALKAGTDFETSFAGVRKTVDATEGQFADLARGFRDLAKVIPVNVNELNRIGEAAGALGIKRGDILEFTEVIAKMGVTTNLTSDQAATAFGQIANVLRLSDKDFSRLGSTLVDLGNKGASTESEITDLMLRLAGSGSTVGLAADQIAGLAAAMANAGIEAEAGGTSMSRVLQRMNEQVATSGPKLAAFAKVAGMSATDFATAFREKPAEAIGAFLEGLRVMRSEGGNVLTTIKELGINESRQIDTLTRLAGAGTTVADTLGIANEAWKANNALNSEAQKRFATTASKIQILKNRFNDIGISLGEALVPVLEQATPVIEKVARAFQTVTDIFASLPGPVKTGIVIFAGILAVLGPILVVVGSIASAIGALATAFGVTAGVIAVAVGAIIAVIAGIIIVAVLVWRHWDKVKGALLAIWGALKSAASAVFGFLKTLFLTFTPAGLIVRHWDTIRTLLSRAWGAMKGAASAVFNFLKNLFLNFTPVGQIIKHWDSIVAFFRSMPGKITRAASGMWNGLKDAFRSAINWIIDKWNRIEFRIPGFDPPGPGPKFKGFTLGLPDIPRLATGGIVTRPTVAMIGEAGPEAVIPLGRAGGVRNYNITVVAPPNVNKAELGRVTIEAIKAYEKGSGPGWRQT